MTIMVPIVEGDGEVEAVAVLIRRIGEDVSPPARPDVLRPFRVHRRRFVKQGEFERYVNLAAIRGGAEARILVLLDADDDCPADLGPNVLQRARAARSDRRIEVVVANREYESWFIAAVDSLQGTRGIPADTEVPQDPDSIRGAREWLRSRMSGPYSPTVDQATFTARFDMALARRRSPSFDRMWRAVSALLQGK